jgi:F-type H+-transporting ATPase subunit b
LGIDWITIAAQIINFLILVWLLKRFLYGPIMKAMAKREQKIRDRLNDAAETKRAAEAEAARLKEMREDLETQRQALIEEARSQAGQLRRKLESEAREEVDARLADWRNQVEDGRATFVADLRRRSVEHFYALAREALGGLANRSLNEAVADAFIERLPEIDLSAADKLRKQTAGNKTPLTIQTSFELSGHLKKRITAAIREQISPEAEVNYQIADDLICGIRLKAGGQTIGWTLAGYLDRLEERALAGIGDMPAIEKRAAE